VHIRRSADQVAQLFGKAPPYLWSNIRDDVQLSPPARRSRSQPDAAVQTSRSGYEQDDGGWREPAGTGTNSGVQCDAALAAFGLAADASNSQPHPSKNYTGTVPELVSQAISLTYL
jgi:hypothetical protein